MITTQSKKWWNNECKTSLKTYKQTRESSDWFFFHSTTKQAKQHFFDNRIAKIASINKKPWDLISWVKQYKLPIVETINFQGQFYNNFPDLWSTLY